MTMTNDQATKLADAVIMDVRQEHGADCRRDYCIKASILRHACPPPRLEWGCGLRKSGTFWWADGGWEIAVNGEGWFFLQRMPNDYHGPMEARPTIEEIKAAAQSHSQEARRDQ